MCVVIFMCNDLNSNGRNRAGDEALEKQSRCTINKGDYKKVRFWLRQTNNKRHKRSSEAGGKTGCTTQR